MFKIGDYVLFIKLKNGQCIGYEKEPYIITNIYNGENTPMFYIKNKNSEFWTNGPALIETSKPAFIKPKYIQQTLF